LQKTFTIIQIENRKAQKLLKLENQINAFSHPTLPTISYRNQLLIADLNDCSDKLMILWREIPEMHSRKKLISSLNKKPSEVSTSIQSLKMLKVVLITVLLLAYSVEANFWSACTATSPNAVAPTSIVSSACTPGSTRCIATRGQPLTAEATFTPIRAHDDLDVVVTAFIFGIGVNLPPEEDSELKMNDDNLLKRIENIRSN
jgi:hypothetical protein